MARHCAVCHFARAESGKNYKCAVTHTRTYVCSLACWAYVERRLLITQHLFTVLSKFMSHLKELRRKEKTSTLNNNKLSLQWLCVFLESAYAAANCSESG